MSAPKTVTVFGYGIHDYCKEGHDGLFMKAKYAFQNVHLIVGIMNGDHVKANSSLDLFYSDEERKESCLHCRYVDEILCDTQWSIDQSFIDKHKIDYVAITDRHVKTIMAQGHVSGDSMSLEQLESLGSYLDLDQVNETRNPQLLNVSKASFSDDPAAIDKRTKSHYDFNNRISLENAKHSPKSRPIRVYADGIYDMFHPGHAKQLAQAKNHSALNQNVHLLVGVVGDELTLRYKGKTEVQEDIRYEKVRNCRHVDEVIRQAPWVLTEQFLIENKIDFVAHDDIPYQCEGQEDVYKHIKELGMFLTTQRTKNISTTDLKVRLKEYRALPRGKQSCYCN